VEKSLPKAHAVAPALAQQETAAAVLVTVLICRAAAVLAVAQVTTALAGPPPAFIAPLGRQLIPDAALAAAATQMERYAGAGVARGIVTAVVRAAHNVTAHFAPALFICTFLSVSAP
jgi:hypothetical protein